MKLIKAKNKRSEKSPCSNCPYKLGVLKTLVNPCIQCKCNNYRTLEIFKRILFGNSAVRDGGAADGI